MSNKWKILLIVGVITFSIWSLYPSYRYYSMTSAERENLGPEEKDKFIDTVLKLGLDLQGGMHLVLEIDDSELDENSKKDAVDRAIRVIRNRIDEFGVSEPVIQKQGEKRIIVQLPGLQDPERARRLIGRTALLQFRLVRENDELGRVLTDLDRVLKGVSVTGSVVDTSGVGVESDTTSAGSTSTDIGVAATAFDSLLGAPIDGALAVPLSGVDDTRPFTSYLLTAVQGAVVVDVRREAVVTALLATDQAQRAIPPSMEFLWGSEKQPLQGGGEGKYLFLVDSKTLIDGSMLIDATTNPDPDDPSLLNVGFRLNRQGAIIFSRVTGDNVGRQLAIVLDDKINSAPVIQGKIPGGEGRITGLDSDEEAADLAIVLRAGALPAPVTIIEERTVGPTLGHDSIVAGTRAAIGGFIIVLIFMMVYYRMSGIVACIALILNLVIVMAILAKLHASLTLPGIAGLILTIGMAIDANVLIFERIREELAKAKTVRSAIESGYNRAFTTIMDANVTTLITAFVLWQFGTGPIKGFATTLSIGIIVSMFTALLVTRVIFDTFTANRQLKKLSI